MKKIHKQTERLKSLIKKLEEYIWAIDFLPPQGEYAKESVKREFLDLQGKIKCELHNICYKVIAQIEKGEE